MKRLILFHSRKCSFSIPQKIFIFKNLYPHFNARKKANRTSNGLYNLSRKKTETHLWSSAARFLIGGMNWSRNSLVHCKAPAVGGMFRWTTTLSPFVIRRKYVSNVTWNRSQGFQGKHMLLYSNILPLPTSLWYFFYEGLNLL